MKSYIYLGLVSLTVLVASCSTNDTNEIIDQKKEVVLNKKIYLNV